MARNKFYTQCRLRRPVKGRSGHFQEMVSWIPSDKAQVGKTVRLKEWPGDTEWSEGWEVLESWSKLAGDRAEAAAVDYLHQREQSDA